MRLFMTMSKSPFDKSDLVACVYQVIRIKTSNKTSEIIYFLGLRLLYRRPMLVSIQPFKINVNSNKILNLLTLVETEKRKIKCD